jgi:hypothetical protein
MSEVPFNVIPVFSSLKLVQRMAAERGNISQNGCCNDAHLWYNERV